MAVRLRYLGWSAFEVTIEDGRRLVLDRLREGVAEEGVPPSPAKLEEFDTVDVVEVCTFPPAARRARADRRGR